MAAQRKWGSYFKKNIFNYVFQAGTLKRILQSDWFLVRSSHRNACVRFFSEFFFHLRAWKKINKLFTGLGSVRIVKNCDLRLSVGFCRGSRVEGNISRVEG